LKLLLTAVLFEAVVLPKMKSRKGDEDGNVDTTLVLAVPNAVILPGPSINDGRAKLVVFVIEGVTCEIVVKASG
jgi:hypothetical protein